MSKRNGFTFIEVVIALAVLVFGIYGALDLYFTGHNVARRARLKTKALYLAKGKLAELQSAGTESLFSLAKKHNGTYKSETAPVSEDQNFLWYWRLNQKGLDEDSLRLEVTVSSKRVKDVSVTLFSYVFAPGEQ
ncbi:prepilin-type N-terminal cleavage/methylation domain-containing protein [Candidatus Sumerlaeota bacterium]|nr:prepilin-type N-terminal cleavage/methylation domain-containing protein [Candidatus Sumerlaeota bacterium]